MIEQLGDWPAVPPAQTVHEAIGWWAERTPDAPALLDIDGGTVSFRELMTRIGAFGARLASLGVGRGDRVVLALPDGVGAAIAGLGASGTAIGVPVNPAQAWREAEPMFAALEPSVVVVGEKTDAVFRDLAIRAGVPVLELDGAGRLEGGKAPGRPSNPAPAPNDLALILMTSGTTDRPRRVPVSHSALLLTCAARVQARKLTPRDRGLSSAPAYFVLGLARVAESLIAGGSAIVTSTAEMVRRPHAIRDARPTWAWLSPAVLETILEAARDNTAFAEWPLRYVRSGGALVTPDLIARAQDLWGVPVLNGYGTTETLGYIASEESPATIPRKPGSVGLPRPGLAVSIRGPAGEPLAPGVAGEIAVRGPGVFPGYLDDAQATAEAFFPGGWYRTGDLGHVDAEGYLFVSGRVREMINRGGEKIAPSEIDDVLRAHPAVADAAAFGLPHARLGEEAAAAVVLREPGALSARAVRRWAASRLSLHKVPHRIWFVADLPRTGSGKVQRGVLAERFRNAANG